MNTVDTVASVNTVGNVKTVGDIKTVAAFPGVSLAGFFLFSMLSVVMDNDDTYVLTPQKLNWKRADDYKKAGRSIWYVEDEIAGYSKTAGNFTELLVRNAGHLVPTDQPKWALDMFNRFIFNQPFDSK